MAMTYGGMLYFPLKVSLFDEMPIELIEAKFGLKGTAAVMKLLCKIYKDNGYYLSWNEEQCTLFANKVGKDIRAEEMQGIVDILVEKEFFDSKIYREQQVLTSIEIQRIWLEATKRRKRNLNDLPHLLVKPEEECSKKTKDEKGGTVEHCMQSQGNCRQDAALFSENADNSEQSRVKQSIVEQRKELPPLTPPGEDGGKKGQPSALVIPEYAYNKTTHNLECLMLSLKDLQITDLRDVQKILNLSDYGRLKHVVWKIISYTKWSGIRDHARYMIAMLVKDLRET